MYYLPTKRDVGHFIRCEIVAAPPEPKVNYKDTLGPVPTSFERLVELGIQPWSPTGDMCILSQLVHPPRAAPGEPQPAPWYNCNVLLSSRVDHIHPASSGERTVPHDQVPACVWAASTPTRVTPLPAPLAIPPFRYARPDGPGADPHDVFSVLTWNVLAPAFAQPGSFPQAPESALAWPLRRALIVREVMSYAPDIVCLQEVNRNAYEGIARDLLKLYNGVFAKHTDARHPHGNATLYRRARFRLIEPCVIEYDGAATHATHRGDLQALTRMLVGNVGLVLTLEKKHEASAYPPPAPRYPPATTTTAPRPAPSASTTVVDAHPPPYALQPGQTYRPTSSAPAPTPKPKPKPTPAPQDAKLDTAGTHGKAGTTTAKEADTAAASTTDTQDDNADEAGRAERGAGLGDPSIMLDETQAPPPDSADGAEHDAGPAAMESDAAEDAGHSDEHAESERAAEEHSEEVEEEHTEGSEEEHAEGSGEEHTEGSEEEHTEGSGEEHTEGSEEEHAEGSGEGRGAQAAQASAPGTAQQKPTRAPTTTNSTAAPAYTTLPRPGPGNNPMVPRNRRVVIANTCLFDREDAPDLKVFQMYLLLRNLARITTYANGTQIPCVLCGDLSVPPQHGVIDLLLRGSITSLHRALDRSPSLFAFLSAPVFRQEPIELILPRLESLDIEDDLDCAPAARLEDAPLSPSSVFAGFSPCTPAPDEEATSPPEASEAQSPEGVEARVPLTPSPLLLGAPPRAAPESSTQAQTPAPMASPGGVAAFSPHRHRQELLGSWKTATHRALQLPDNARPGPLTPSEKASAVSVRLQHPMRFRNTFESVVGRFPAATSCPFPRRPATVDYIFHTAPLVPLAAQEHSAADVREPEGLVETFPNMRFPSDHYHLIVQFERFWDDTPLSASSYSSYSYY